jgi:hypothetical protein
MPKVMAVADESPLTNLSFLHLIMQLSRSGVL